MLLYIRHGHDEYDNATYRDDTRLTPLGQKQGQDLGQALMKTYRRPDIIYCSPCRRTMDMVRNMLSLLSDEEFDKIDVMVYTRLSRYFHGEQRNNPDIAPETDEWAIPTNETLKEFGMRCNAQFDEIEDEVVKSNKHIWVVTHTMVYKRAARRHNVELPRVIPFASHFPVAKTCEKCKGH